MNKRDIISFFDHLAPQWDADMIRSDAIINVILDNAKVRSGVRVLDVACGTGVLIGDYLNRQVASVTGVDISPEMVKIARGKFSQENVQILCGDIETVALSDKFDCIMVYNAFPHFPDPENLIRVLSCLLTPGGTLTVAHGMSRAKIDAHHQGTASKVSCGLVHEDILAEMMAKYLTVIAKISNDQMYQVTATKE